MTARPMTAGERAEALIRWCSLQADLRDYAEFMSDGIEKNRLMVERARFKQIIELLLSTSAAVRGMREALEKLNTMHNTFWTSSESWMSPREKSGQIIKAALSVEGDDEQARVQGRSAP